MADYCEICKREYELSASGTFKDGKYYHQSCMAEKYFELRMRECSHSTGVHNEQCDLVNGLEKENERLNARLERVAREAYCLGYITGHHDTVESVYRDPDEVADEWVDEDPDAILNESEAGDGN